MNVQNAGALMPGPSRDRSHPGASSIIEDAGVAAGSRVLTRRGEVLVESLSVGEEVLTPIGEFSRVTFLAFSRPSLVDAAACPAHAIRIERDAFGPMQPHRDVVVSPGQMLLVAEGPRMAETLLGRSRISLDRPGGPIVRVGLDPPAAMMVEGLALGGSIR